MKTNQVMNVKVGKHTITIGQKDQMGSLNDVFDAGNAYRKERGLQATNPKGWLKSQKVSEFLWAVECKYFKDNEILNRSCLPIRMASDFTYLQSSVVISSKGRYGGTKATLHVLLAAAEWLDPFFHLD